MLVVVTLSEGAGLRCWWPWPSRKGLGCGIHPAESHALCPHQSGCGNPDRGPRRTCSPMGLRLQGMPALSLEWMAIVRRAV